jgi:hypothetical protein
MKIHKAKLIIIALLLVATIVVYWPAVNHAFISYDDPAYVTDNTHVRTGFTNENIRWAFTTTLMGNWNPVTWLFQIPRTRWTSSDRLPRYACANRPSIISLHDILGPL